MIPMRKNSALIQMCFHTETLRRKVGRRYWNLTIMMMIKAREDDVPDVSMMNVTQIRPLSRRKYRKYNLKWLLYKFGQTPV